VLKRIFLLTVVLISLGISAESKQPTFKITTIDGKTITIQGSKNGLILPEHKGKVIFLEFWGTHCPPCLFSIPKYIELNKKYKDKVEMLAIEVQGTPKEALKAFAKEKGMNYDIFTQNDTRSFVRYIAQRAGWRGAIPFLIVFDRNGNVVDIQRGLARDEFQKLEAIINYLYSKKPASANADANKTKENNTSEANSTASQKTVKESNTTK